jgi:dTDP-4-dehydrorhamnose 3,5-epimerase
VPFPETEAEVKLLSVKSLAIPEVKVLRFGRFRDHRGYFTETYRKSDFLSAPELAGCFDNAARDAATAPQDLPQDLFVQANESFSRPGTIRGLHFQWNPYVGKLVRTVYGRMIDLVLDIRMGSPTVGKILAYDIPASPDRDEAEWIWVPPGFAHGNFFPQETLIEYFCTGHWNPACEAGISPLSPDIDWSLCDPELRRMFLQLAAQANGDSDAASWASQGPLLSDKDRNGYSVAGWLAEPRAEVFTYGQL